MFMAECMVCEEFTEDVFYFTDELGEELILCQYCFEKMKKEYRKGNLLISFGNRADTVEIWYDEGTYIVIIFSENTALVDEITF